jgi:hypothetical protein
MKKPHRAPNDEIGKLIKAANMSSSGQRLWEVGSALVSTITRAVTTAGITKPRTTTVLRKLDFRRINGKAEKNSMTQIPSHPKAEGSSALEYGTCQYGRPTAKKEARKEVARRATLVIFTEQFPKDVTHHVGTKQCADDDCRASFKIDSENGQQGQCKKAVNSYDHPKIAG